MLSSRPVSFAENQAYPVKTPRRAKNRVENDIPTTKGFSKVHSKESALRTPFRPDAQPLQKGSSAVNTTQGKSILLVPRTVSRPLGDKTPFPNRTNNKQFETPAPQLLKPQVLAFLESQPQVQPGKTPETQLRPSSGRKQDRVPKSASKIFETPLNNGNYWDVSELSIEIPEALVQEKEPEDDYDEIEYMPPNTLDLAYQPPFDFELPDYKEVGKTLFKLAHSYPCEDIPVAEIQVDESDIPLPVWDMLPLPELESDDPFVQALGRENSVASAPTKPASYLKERARPTPKMTKPVTAAPQRVLRATSSVAPKSTTTSMPSSRPGTSNSTARSAKSKDVARSAAVHPPVVRKQPLTAGKGKALPTPRAPVVSSLRPASTTTTTSRPPTATATRSRVANTAALTAGPVRRPATSSSSYKTVATVPVHSTNSKRSGTENIKERRLRTTIKKANQGSDDLILFVDSREQVDDDFRFDV